MVQQRRPLLLVAEQSAEEEAAAATVLEAPNPRGALAEGGAAQDLLCPNPSLNQTCLLPPVTASSTAMGARTNLLLNPPMSRTLPVKNVLAKSRLGINMNRFFFHARNSPLLVAQAKTGI
jgi:hypothetical protein